MRKRTLKKTVSRKLGPTGPAAIMQAVWGFMTTRVLFSATELDLFTKMDERCHTVQDLAKATNTTERGMRMLVDALTGLGLLIKTGRHYELTRQAKVFLSKKSPAYIGGMALHTRQEEANWSKLTEVLRTGKPPVQIEGTEDGGGFFSEFVDSLFHLNVQAANVAANALLKRISKKQREIRVLDVGAGSAVWSLAFAKLDPRVRVIAVDFPRVIQQVTKPIVEREGASSQVDYVADNFHVVEFGRGQFDIAILGHICHCVGEQKTKRLLDKLRHGLKPDGYVLIVEFIADDERATTVLPLLFAINMLVQTEDGDSFTLAEYRKWLKQSGYRKFETIEASSFSPLIVAKNQP